MNVPYPGMPPRPDGPRYAAWKAKLDAYNASVEECNRRFDQGVRNGVEFVLLCCLFAIWELLR